MYSFFYHCGGAVGNHAALDDGRGDEYEERLDREGEEEGASA
jgi:hypothetical protein